MEMEDILTRNEATRKSQMAIRCAKSAMLLLSLKSSHRHPCWETAPPDQKDEEEKQRMLRTIDDLRMQLLRERMKIRKMKLCSLMEFILHIVLLLSLFIVSLMLALQFFLA